MPSTLYGIYNAQRSLSMSQAALDIINSNVANMNTVGYSKQRLDIQQVSNSSAYEDPLEASQSGAGAVIQGITRNRDVFLDNYYRTQNADLSYYKEYADNAIQMEDIVNELGDNGLNESMTNFYNSLSQLASNPNDYVVRTSVIQNAVALATKFNDSYSGLEDLRTSLVGEFGNADSISQSKLSLNVDDLNDKLRAVANLNNQINLSTVQGITPNALLDQRDLLLDRISEYIPVTLNYENNNTVSVNVGQFELVKGTELKGVFSVTAGPDDNNPSTLQITNDNGGIISKNAYSLLNSGKLGAILQVGGNDSSKLTIKEVMDSLNTLAGEFSNAINTVQLNGRYIDNSSSPYELSNNTSNPIDATLPLDADPEAMFLDSDASGTINAKNISVNQNLINNPYFVCAAALTSGLSETGDGSNSLAMSQVRNQNIATLGGTTTQGFISSFVGVLGSKSSTIQNSYDVKDNVVSQLEQKRESKVGVNLDEELTDLIRYQKSYEAAAKIMKTINETLSTIINMV